MNYIFVGLALASAALLMFGLGRALRTYLKFRGKRIVSCPETHEAAAVRVAARDAALQATVGRDELMLSE